MDSWKSHANVHTLLSNACFFVVIVDGICVFREDVTILIMNAFCMKFYGTLYFIRKGKVRQDLAFDRFVMFVDTFQTHIIVII